MFVCQSACCPWWPHRGLSFPFSSSPPSPLHALETSDTRRNISGKGRGRRACKSPELESDLQHTQVHTGLSPRRPQLVCLWLGMRLGVNSSKFSRIRGVARQRANLRSQGRRGVRSDIGDRGSDLHQAPRTRSGPSSSASPLKFEPLARLFLRSSGARFRTTLVVDFGMLPGDLLVGPPGAL